MRRLISFAFLLVGHLVIMSCLLLWIAQAHQQANSSVSGRVTVAGKPAPGVTIVLTTRLSDPSNFFGLMYQSAGTFKSRTGEDGTYRVDSLAAGRYQIVVLAPAMVSASNVSDTRVTSISEGEQVEGIDFELIPGGVVTGRVTDGKGRPVIGAIVDFTDEAGGSPRQSERGLSQLMGGSTYRTDDRGVYRLFGLPAGRYVISVATSELEKLIGGRRSMPETFHPGVTDRKKATVVEVGAGGEITGVDIRVGADTPTYTARGQLIDGDTGRPISKVVVTYIGSPDGAVPVRSSSFYNTNDRGEFRFEGLKPGKYDAFAVFDQDSHYYAETAKFEISNSDTTGIIVRARQGLSISGVAVIEGDAGGRGDFSQTSVSCFRVDAANSSDRVARIGGTTIAADGSFRIMGLRAGNYRIVSTDFFRVTGVALIRVERSDSEPEGGIIPVRPGEPVSDVRLVFARTNRAIRGKVIVLGGPVPRDVAFEISVRGQPNMIAGGGGYEADAAGNFVIDRLAPGEYHLFVEMVDRSRTPRVDPVSRLTANETVVVSAEADAEVTITFDLSRRNQ